MIQEIYANRPLSKPIKLWIGINEIEESALLQLTNLSKLPFAHSHIVALPGIHTGFGMPIETVLATDGVIIPNAV